MTPARALMLQGTGSSVGKSTLVAGLARALTRRGLRVRPFKPQNMSNNAAVTREGGEIGRAQALQALACRVPPSVHMNPVLLKPQGSTQGGAGSQTGAQLVVRGQVRGTVRARAFQAMKPGLLSEVLDSFETLRAEADIVLVEGAGSASEINLRAGDIANMGFARATGTPVVVVGDIDRGGVIASLVGTRAVLAEDDATLVVGFIVNRMRGDLSLFADGMRIIAERTGWQPFGLVAHLDQVRALPAEDTADLAPGAPGLAGDTRFPHVAVPLLPHIANHDDLDPLRAEPGLSLVLVPPGRPLPRDCGLVILPGSKATIADLMALRAQGWDIDLLAHRRQGGRILGLCGGYQMLGERIDDPLGLEGPPGSCAGLGLLALGTVLQPRKRLAETQGQLVDGGAAVAGYEMHMGVTAGPDTARPMLRLANGHVDGAVSADGLVAGCYLHGLFSTEAARRSLLGEFGQSVRAGHHAGLVEDALDRLADHLEAHVAIDALLDAAR